MIKKSVFENELIHGMQRELHAHDKKQGMNNLVKAAEHLHSALEILEESGLTAQADRILGILNKIACNDVNHAHDHGHKHKIPQVDTRESEKMLENLKNHGTVFDKGKAEDFDLKKVVKDVTDKGGAFNMAFNVPEDQDTEDLLNAEIGGETIEVSEPDPEKTFEDSD